MLKKIALALCLAGSPTVALAGPTTPAPAPAPAPVPAKATTAQFTVTGMHCSHCGDHVKAALTKVTGVQKVDVDLDKKLVVVTYDASKATPAALQKAIEGAGFKVTPSA